MRYQRDAARARRTGFTLVEMMVVLVLMLIVGAVAIMFVPRINEQQKALKGADQVQGALLAAKMRALRDQAPRGVRIVPVPIILSSNSSVTMTGVVTAIQCATS